VLGPGNSISEFWRGGDGCTDGRVAVFLADEVENAGLCETVGSSGWQDPVEMSLRVILPSQDRDG
jgi:hypothetical protein